MAEYCTIEDIEIYLGIDITSIDITNDPSCTNDDYDKYSFLISAVSKEIENICQRVLLAADYTQVLDANGSNSIFLSNYPIQSITSIKYGSPFDSTRSEITEYISYSDTAQISFAGEFPESPQMFEVVYNAGFSTVPLDLNLIAVEEVVRAFKLSTKDTNIESEKLGDYSYKLSSSATSSAENNSNLRNKLSAYIKNDI